MRRTLVRTLLSGSAFIAGLAVLSLGAKAGDVILFQDVPSAEEINSVLFGDDSNAPEGLRTRSIKIVEPSARALQNQTRAIRLHDAAAPTSTQSVAASTDGPALESDGVGLGFNLQFGFDSVEILPESRTYVDRLGEVLGAPENQDKALLILGHTDATGSSAYNDTLSVNRAIAVRTYLATSWDVSVDRLQVQGAGEQQPIDGVDPNDGVNRRVEFFAIN
jgi:outer membrane protein OmpA-like peptidoglycan-associated protein